MLDNVVKYLSLITIAAILLSFAYLNSYYNAFGVNILSFISNVDLLFSLLPFASFVFSFGILLVQMRATTSTNIFTDEVIVTKKQFIILIITLAVVLILRVILNVIFGVYIGSNFHDLILNSLAIISAWIAPYKRFKIVKFTSADIIVFFIAAAYLITQYASGSARVTKKFGATTKYEIIAHGMRSTTSNNYFIIGQTQSHLFFYNKTDSSTTIVKLSDIDTIRVRDIN